jgi:putative copper resistance protein D
VPSASKSSSPTPLLPPSKGHRGADGLGVSTPWLLTGLLALILGLGAALLFSGAATSRDVSDPGAFVRWGLPVSEAIHNISLATVIGGLIFAVGILPRSVGGSRSKVTQLPEHPAFTRALTIASAAGVAWTMSAIAVLVLTYAEMTNSHAPWSTS